MKQLIAALFLCAPLTFAGGAPFSVEAREDVSADFPGAPRLHSFAFAQWQGKWVFIGGRTNGYHSVGGGPAEFMRADANDQVWVIDTTVHPARTYHAPVADLPASHVAVKDQWIASAFSRIQVGDKLYIAGGYGQDHTGSWVTHALLSVVSIPALVEGVMHGKVPPESVRFLETPWVQSAGGGLIKIPGGNFYLVMGHVFTGSYTAFEGNAEENTKHASQIYLEEVRELKITEGEEIAVELLQRFHDSEFHRRDLNVVPLYSPKGAGFAAYGGVFTPRTQLNYTKPVYMVPGQGLFVDSIFEQKMHSYSTARLLLYDKAKATMYTTFFGGISRNFWDAYAKAFVEYPTHGDRNAAVYLDGLQWNDQISSLAHGMNESDGKTVEWVHAAELPAYLGTDGFFIPRDDLAEVDPGTQILDLGPLRGKRTLVGYLYGGIRAFPYRFPYDKSAQPYNAGTIPSKASESILNVYLTVPGE